MKILCEYGQMCIKTSHFAGILDSSIPRFLTSAEKENFHNRNPWKSIDLLSSGWETAPGKAPDPLGKAPVPLEALVPVGRVDSPALPTCTGQRTL